VAQQLLLELLLEVTGGLYLSAEILDDLLRGSDLRVHHVRRRHRDVALVEPVDLLEAKELVLHRGALLVLPAALVELHPICVDGSLECVQVRRSVGDLARVVRGHAGRQRLELLCDPEQLVIVGRRQLTSLDADADDRLDPVGQVGDVLVLEQDLVADRVPQLAVAGVAGLDLGA
jgi:hypothetical protein